MIVGIILYSLTITLYAKYAKEKITFADAGWTSMQFHNEVARTIVEKGYGYQTDVVTGSISVLFLGLKRGDVDV